MKEKQNLVWDVSDLNPVTEFPKDCRRFNGGYICPEPLELTPIKKESDKPPATNNLIVIDRLRP